MQVESFSPSKIHERELLHTNIVTFIHVIMLKTPPLQLVIDYFQMRSPHVNLGSFELIML